MMASQSRRGGKLALITGSAACGGALGLLFSLILLADSPQGTLIGVVLGLVTGAIVGAVNHEVG